MDREKRSEANHRDRRTARGSEATCRGRAEGEETDNTSRAEMDDRKKEERWATARSAEREMEGVGGETGKERATRKSPEAWTEQARDDGQQAQWVWLWLNSGRLELSRPPELHLPGLFGHSARLIVGP